MSFVHRIDVSFCGFTDRTDRQKSFNDGRNTEYISLERSLIFMQPSVSIILRMATFISDSEALRLLLIFSHAVFQKHWKVENSQGKDSNFISLVSKRQMMNTCRGSSVLWLMNPTISYVLSVCIYPKILWCVCWSVHSLLSLSVFMDLWAGSCPWDVLPWDVVFSCCVEVIHQTSMDRTSQNAEEEN